MSIDKIIIREVFTFSAPLRLLTAFSQFSDSFRHSFYIVSIYFRAASFSSWTFRSIKVKMQRTNFTEEAFLIYCIMSLWNAENPGRGHVYPLNQWTEKLLWTFPSFWQILVKHNFIKMHGGNVIRLLPRKIKGRNHLRKSKSNEITSVCQADMSVKAVSDNFSFAFPAAEDEWEPSPENLQHSNNNCIRHLWLCLRIKRIKNSRKNHPGPTLETSPYLKKTRKQLSRRLSVLGLIFGPSSFPRVRYGKEAPHREARHENREKLKSGF